MMEALAHQKRQYVTRKGNPFVKMFSRGSGVKYKKTEIVIKAFMTAGKPKASNQENVLESTLCACSLLPGFHPFAQTSSKTSPLLELLCGPPVGPSAHLLPWPALQLPGHLLCSVPEGIGLSHSSPGTPKSSPLNSVDTWEVC